MEKHDIDRLEKTLRECGAGLRGLGEKGSEVEELVTIIRRPGWTTLAEAAFAEGIAKSIANQAQAFVGLVEVLVRGASTVGR